jgi:hypothetical protein
VDELKVGMLEFRVGGMVLASEYGEGDWVRSRHQSDSSGEAKAALKLVEFDRLLLAAWRNGGEWVEPETLVVSSRC